MAKCARNLSATSPESHIWLIRHGTTVPTSLRFHFCVRPPKTRELDDGSPIVDVEIRPCPKAGRKNLSSTPRPRLIAIFGSPNTSDLWLFNFGDETFGHPPRNDTSLWTLLAKVVRKCMFSSGHPPRCAVPPNGLDCADLTDFNRATIASASTH